MYLCIKNHIDGTLYATSPRYSAGMRLAPPVGSDIDRAKVGPARPDA